MCIYIYISWRIHLGFTWNHSPTCKLTPRPHAKQGAIKYFQNLFTENLFPFCSQNLLSPNSFFKIDFPDRFSNFFKKIFLHHNRFFKSFFQHDFSKHIFQHLLSPKSFFTIGFPIRFLSTCFLYPFFPKLVFQSRFSKTMFAEYFSKFFFPEIVFQNRFSKSFAWPAQKQCPAMPGHGQCGFGMPKPH